MLLDVWDSTSLAGQERVIGRRKHSGAPIGGRNEHDPPVLDDHAVREPKIPVDAHIRLAAPQTNGGVKLLRRSYSFADGVDDAGHQDAGLVFICFQRDPRHQFVPLQRKLAGQDALNRHILHTGSAVFACPPGVQPGGFIADGLFRQT